MCSRISVKVGIGVPPLFCRDAEQCYVQDIRFRCEYDTDLFGSEFMRNEMPSYSIRVDMVIDFSQLSFGTPAYLGLFF